MGDVWRVKGEVWQLDREGERQRAVWMMRFVFAVACGGLVAVALWSGLVPLRAGRPAGTGGVASVAGETESESAGGTQLLPPLEGYRYRPGPPQLQGAFDGLTGPARAAGHDVRFSVVEDAASGATIALVVAARTAPGQPAATHEELRAQVASASGGSVEDVTLSGTAAVRTQSSDGVRLYSWLTADGFLTVGGQDPAALEALARTLIANQ
ncbi:MAG: hypothetical protein M3276_01060 [Actinomycetota bacterium]|nr:hypothetical protein [Actinomycetota bacterium]